MIGHLRHNQSNCLGRTYGSGYPGFANQRGVNSLGFPFYFWPVVWGSAIGLHTQDAYLHDSEVRRLTFTSLLQSADDRIYSTASRIIVQGLAASS